jgi:hypothetical protein
VGRQEEGAERHAAHHPPRPLCVVCAVGHMRGCASTAADGRPTEVSGAYPCVNRVHVMLKAWATQLERALACTAHDCRLFSGTCRNGSAASCLCVETHQERGSSEIRSRKCPPTTSHCLSHRGSETVPLQHKLADSCRACVCLLAVLLMLSCGGAPRGCEQTRN